MCSRPITRYVCSTLAAAQSHAAYATLAGISYRTAKKGSGIRKEMEDRGGKWRRLETAPHYDRVEEQIIADWWHSVEASCEDNQNKEEVVIFGDKRDPETGKLPYWVSSYCRGLRGTTVGQGTIRGKG